MVMVKSTIEITKISFNKLHVLLHIENHYISYNDITYQLSKTYTVGIGFQKWLVSLAYVFHIFLFSLSECKYQHS